MSDIIKNPILVSVIQYLARGITIDQTRLPHNLGK
jgi:hypothetical protein